MIDVGVRVDQPGQHQLAANVDDLPGAGRQNVVRDRGNLAVADRDILDAIDAGGRTDHATASQ